MKCHGRKGYALDRLSIIKRRRAEEHGTYLQIECCKKRGIFHLQS
jgi:hypothetical protein